MTLVPHASEITVAATTDTTLAVPNLVSDIVFGYFEACPRQADVQTLAMMNRSQSSSKVEASRGPKCERFHSSALAV